MSSFRRTSQAALLCLSLIWSTTAMAAPADGDKQLNTLRHGLGAATASALYHTHLFIGATADGFKGKVFEARQIREALSASVKVTAALVDDLGRIRSAEPPAEDAAQLDELIAIGQLVMEEARLLHAFVNKGGDPAEQAFAKRHSRVRTRLGKLLQL